MNIPSLSDHQLLTETRIAVAEERKLTARVLAHLKEVERRGLHLQSGFSSLFEFCMKDLGYSESEANARISAMRLSREIPEVTSAVEDGKLSLSNLVRAQSFFRQEKKAGSPVSIESKRELLTELEGKSTRECERMLADRSPSQMPQERTRVISSENTQISFTADAELMADLERIRALWGHQDLSYAELIRKMAKLTLAKIDPLRKPDTQPKESPRARQVIESINETPPELVPAKNRHIPAAIRQLVWKRDLGRCTYVNAGSRCSSHFALEIDHVDPYAFGGSHDASNLRLLCRAHHRLRSVN